ncbi:MAG: C40 family peptidase [Actinobacteria bacterium]|nr:C40 family peptidase [Actinomycetota bacterium]
MVGAGVISVGLVGTFALPAYAAQEEPTDDLPFTYSSPQQLVAAEADGSVQAQLPKAQKKAVISTASTLQTNSVDGQPQQGMGGKDLPAGKGAAGLVAAALAQVGDFQDCTAMVERALRAIGYPVGDLGTQVAEYAPYGKVLTAGAYAPGDILIWPGAHVAIYIGNGRVVHGGWTGGTTAIAGLQTIHGLPSVVVRVG